MHKNLVVIRESLGERQSIVACSHVKRTDDL